MRRSCLLGLTLFLLLGLLAACGEAPDKENPRLPASEACLTGRVAAVEGAQLLVASLEEGAGESDVYAVSLGQCPVAYQDPDQGAIRPGDRIQVGYGGTVEETFPARLGEVTGILVEASGFDDLCALYLQVLEDLWTVDDGLNGGITQVGVDLSQVPGLTDGERSAIAWAFAAAHNVSSVTGTLEELWEEGYFTPTTEPAEGYEDSLALYCWEDGVHFSIDVDEEAVWNLPSLGPGEEPPELVAFDAQKWRSGLGAYFFGDCVGQRGEDGAWTYTVGAELIA